MQTALDVTKGRRVSVLLKARGWSEAPETAECRSARKAPSPLHT